MRKRPHKRAEISPASLLQAELAGLRRDLRTTVQAYAARLEITLAESALAVDSAKATETLSRERLDKIRRLMVEVHNRKLKPEKGRRKDLRRIDDLIRDVHSFTHPDRLIDPSR